MMKSLFSYGADPAKVRAMEPFEAEIMLRVLLAEQSQFIKPSKASDLFKNAPSEPPPAVLTMLGCLRMAEEELLYSEGVIILLAQLATNPGRAVIMLAHELVTATLKRGQCVDMSYFGQEVCPWGFPTDEAFRESWASQKTLSGNWLDTPEAWHG